MKVAAGLFWLSVALALPASAGEATERSGEAALARAAGGVALVANGAGTAASGGPAPVPAPPPRPTEWWQGDGPSTVVSAGEKGRPSTPRIELFEKSKQRGHRTQLEGPIADVTDLGYPVGSVVVKGGSWQLCSQPDFEGECRVVDGSSEKLANGMVVSSLRPTPN
jgi:hypothetical protein